MAPIFVGSENENSRVRSDRLGFAASTSDPGTAAEGDGYYNSSDNQLKFYDGSSWSAIQGSGTVEMVASGTLSNGQTVIVTSDGKVAGVSTSQVTQAIGSLDRYNSGYTNHVASDYDASTGRLVIAYQDEGNNDYGTAVVGTVDVDNNSISFGSEVVFESATTNWIAVTYDANAEKVVISYQDGGNSSYGTAIVGTVDGTSINFGSPTVFESATTDRIHSVYDSNAQKVVIFYQDRGNSNYGTAIVGTVSGTSISFGSATVFESANTSEFSGAFDSCNNKVVIAYKDLGNSNYGTAVVGTVSDTSISFGTPVVFESANTEYTATAFDSENKKIVIAYRDAGNSNKGTYIVGTVSGTSISFGTAGYFEDANSDHIGLAYDAAAKKFVIVYGDVGNSDAYTVNNGTLSGTTVTWGTPELVTGATSGRGQVSSVVYASDVKRITVAYRNNAVSGVGSAFVYRNSYVDTNLTTENFIGFSDAAYTNGQTANIQIISSIDDAQSGLTTGSLHYVQTDGTLSTTAGTPSVEAGTALSDTKIRIKS
jgi:uncharacterized protein (UPF0248 family)